MESNWRGSVTMGRTRLTSMPDFSMESKSPARVPSILGGKLADRRELGQSLCSYLVREYMGMKINDHGCLLKDYSCY